MDKVDNFGQKNKNTGFINNASNTQDCNKYSYKFKVYKYNKNNKKKQDKIFEKYAIHYQNGVNGKDEYTKEQREHLLNRQRYIFDGLCNKSINETNIQVLLDITRKELELTETIKQNIEYKVGFILALLGILISALLQNKVLNQLWKIIIDEKETLFSWLNCVIAIICILGLLITGIFTIYLIYKSLKNYNYKSIILDEENYMAAVDDKNISLVAILEACTDNTIINRGYNNKKARDLQKLIKVIIFFVGFVIIASILVA